MGENQSKPLDRNRRKKKRDSKRLKDSGNQEALAPPAVATSPRISPRKPEPKPLAYDSFGIDRHDREDPSTRRENILTKSRRFDMSECDIQRGSPESRQNSPFFAARGATEKNRSATEPAESKIPRTLTRSSSFDNLFPSETPDVAKNRLRSTTEGVESLEGKKLRRKKSKSKSRTSSPMSSADCVTRGDSAVEKCAYATQEEPKKKRKKKKKKKKRSTGKQDDAGGAYLLKSTTESPTDSNAYEVVEKPTSNKKRHRDRRQPPLEELEPENAYLIAPPKPAFDDNQRDGGDGGGYLAGNPANAGDDEEEEDEEDDINWSDLDSDFGPSDGSEEEEEEEEENKTPNLARLLDDLRKLSPEELYEVSQDVSSLHPGFIPDLQECLADHFALKQALGEDEAGSDYDDDDQEEAEFVPSKSRDIGEWNHRFQNAIMDLHENGQLRSERMRIYSELSDLAQDFINNAKTYGRIIISEVETPFEKKTIKPVDVGGFAGGEKYIVNGIMFKFAVDVKGLYGSDEAAIKVAGHELKGLISYFNLGLTDVHFPLMALVDYLGYRLTALSVLPIRPDTIVYGSSDAGKNMHASDTILNAKMRKAAKLLNLSGHIAGLNKETSKEIHAAGDIEGHEVDGHFYLIDFSRAFPPSTFDYETSPKMSFLYRLLRPEFVRKYRKSLCPDAYSGFVSKHNGEEYILEVEEATDFLLNVSIPNFASKINEMSEAERMELTHKLKEALHNEGINMRYLGNLRQHVTVKDIKHVLLVEMIARVIKHQLRIKMRKKMHEMHGLLESALRRLIIDHFNLVFESSAESTAWWDSTLKEELEQYFPCALSDQERLFPLKRMLYRQDLCNLFKRVLKMANVKLNPKAEEEFSTNGNVYRAENGENPFDVTYLEEIGISVRHMNIVALAQGYVLKSKARAPNLCGLNKTRLCRMAIDKFKEALSDNPGDKRVLRELADSADIIGEKQMAWAFYKRAIQADSTDPNTLFKYAVFLEESVKDFQRAEEVYLQTLEHNPEHDHCLQRYADFLESQGNFDSAEQFYIRAAECRLNANILRGSGTEVAVAPSAPPRSLTKTSTEPLFF